jgi:hypothetical protein
MASIQALAPIGAPRVPAPAHVWMGRKWQLVRRPLVLRKWQLVRRPLVLLALPFLAAPLAAQTDTDIYLLALDRAGERVTVVGAPTAVTDRAGYDNQPLFTADGRSILYTSIRDDQADTYRYDLATRRSVRVTRTPESEYSPTPIPGTDRFSAVRVERDSTQRLWSFAPDGSDARLLLPDVAPVGYHAWITPDTVALFVLGDPATLHLADVGPGPGREVVVGIGRSIQPVPTRRAVSYTRHAEGEWWLEERELGTGEVHYLAPLLGPDEYHAWAPDGALLTAHGTAIYQWVGGDWVQVADLGRHGLGPVSRLAVSPDGGLLAVVVDRPPAEPAPLMRVP